MFKTVEKTKELESLYKCYAVLESSSLSKSDSDAGKLTLYEAMYGILSSEDVFPIIAQGNQCPLEDYIYHVMEDTPDFIDRLKNFLRSSNE